MNNKVVVARLERLKEEVSYDYFFRTVLDYLNTDQAIELADYLEDECTGSSAY